MTLRNRLYSVTDLRRRGDWLKSVENLASL